jgi:cytochrome c5
VKKFATVMAVVGLLFTAGVNAKPTKEISAAPLGERSLFASSNVAQRIRLVGSVCLVGQPCAEEVVAAPAATETAVARSGEEVYNAACMACHSAGVMGAPVTGDKGQWGARIAQGKETLYQHSINGFNAMPAKGGCASCSDDDIKAAVDFLVAKAQ